MYEQLSDRAKGQFYTFSVLLAALLVRVLVGLGKPIMSMEQSLVVGLTTVVFLTPFLYRTFYGEELIDSTRKRISHGAAMLLSGALFFWMVALTA